MATVAAERPETDESLFRTLTEGGDERISLDPATGLNRYHCGPRPNGKISYASSTANSLSPAALDHLRRLPALADPRLYSVRLDGLRDRIRRAYGLGRDVDVVFAPSGTDLEYVALAATPDAGRSPLMNILLGANEVGSGCIHSANGRYFADVTALGVATRPGVPVSGLAGSRFTMVDIPLRDPLGRPRDASDIRQAIDDSIGVARTAGQHALVHAVHVSKTGLVVPGVETMDILTARHGWQLSWVVDACQGRIGPEEVRAYLDREAIVLLTGSKFVGGPPFSGFALVPDSRIMEAAPLPEGLASIFLQGEWPPDWPGARILPDGANAGLLLRLEAAIFELERFRLLQPADARRVIGAFQRAVAELIRRLDVAPVPTGRSAGGLGPEAGTLVTLDLSALAQDADSSDAQRWCSGLVERGVRLGQPVRYASRPDGRWKPCLRISLSMPMIVERARLGGDSVDESFHADMASIEAALTSCLAAER